MTLLSVSLNIVYYTTFSTELGRFWQKFTMFFGIKSRPICRHASEDVERDIRATVSPTRGRVPALCLVPGINIHVVVDHRNTNLLIGFLNVFVILALVFLALTYVYVVRCLHEQVFQNGQSCGALEPSNPVLQLSYLSIFFPFPGGLAAARRLVASRSCAVSQ